MYGGEWYVKRAVEIQLVDEDASRVEKWLAGQIDEEHEGTREALHELAGAITKLADELNKVREQWAGERRRFYLTMAGIAATVILTNYLMRLLVP